MYQIPWMCTGFMTPQPLCTRLRAVENSKVIYSKTLVCLDRILGFMLVLRRPGATLCRPPSCSICQYWMLMWTGETITIAGVTNVCSPQSKFILRQLEQPRLNHSSCAKRLKFSDCSLTFPWWQPNFPDQINTDCQAASLRLLQKDHFRFKFRWKLWVLSFIPKIWKFRSDARKGNLVRLECSGAPMEAVQFDRSERNVSFHFGEPIRCLTSLQKISDTILH